MLSVTAAAAALDVSRPALSSLLNGSANLSGDMALRIAKAFGVKMDTLMRMQASYDRFPRLQAKVVAQPGSRKSVKLPNP